MKNGSRPLSFEAYLVVLFPARYFLMHSPGMLTIYTYHHTSDVVGEWSPTIASEQTLWGGAGKGMRAGNYVSGI